MTLLLIWLGCVCLIALIGGLLLVAYQRGYDAGATDREYRSLATTRTWTRSGGE